MKVALVATWNPAALAPRGLDQVIHFPAGEEVDFAARELLRHHRKQVEVLVDERLSLESADLNRIQVPALPPRPTPRRLAFFPSNGPIARSFLPVLERLPDVESRVFVPATKDERAAAMLAEARRSFEPFSERALRRFAPDRLLLGNDWGTEEQFVVAACRRAEVMSLCLQESTIDLADPVAKRMRRADLALVQGLRSAIELGRGAALVTGNPRYEQLATLPLPSQRRALVNCNFTYGVFEEQREAWLRAVVGSLERAGIDYRISQHPRDRGDLSAFDKVLASGAGVVQQQLADSTFVVSRFSSLLHEALCLGRKAIYFNPHGEQMYDYAPDERALWQARTPTELDAAIEAQGSEADPEGLERYLLLHCRGQARPASQRVAELLMDPGLSPAGDALSVPWAINRLKFEVLKRRL